MMKCIGCGRKPEELMEFVVYAEEHGMTPREFVVKYEGTFNKFQKNKFYCTPCYIKAGMPLIGRDQ